MEEPPERLIVEERGSGPTLVLVHGFLGSARHWDAQVADLSKSFHCIVPNLAGFGDSAGLWPQNSIAGHATQILYTLDAMGIESFALLGHSMGGMIAQQMAAMVSRRIDRLILYGTGPVGVLPDRFETIAASRLRLETEGLETTARRIAATWFKTADKAAGFEVCLFEGRRASLAAALASLSAWEGWDGRAALASFSMPALVIWGDGDRSYGWPQPEALWRTIPGCRLAVMPGCAHAAHMEKPWLFNLILQDFLQDD